MYKTFPLPKPTSSVYLRDLELPGPQVFANIRPSEAIVTPTQLKTSTTVTAIRPSYPSDSLRRKSEEGQVTKRYLLSGEGLDSRHVGGDVVECWFLFGDSAVCSFYMCFCSFFIVFLLPLICFLLLDYQGGF